MSDPNVFPDQVFPLEYWPLEYWPISIVVIEEHGCVDLNDWLNSDVIIGDGSVSIATLFSDKSPTVVILSSDELVNVAMLSDLSNSDAVTSDTICPN